MGVRTSGTLAFGSSGTFLFLSHFDIVCDLLLNRRAVTRKLFVKLNWHNALCMLLLMKKVATSCIIDYRCTKHFEERFVVVEIFSRCKNKLHRYKYFYLKSKSGGLGRKFPGILLLIIINYTQTFIKKIQKMSVVENSINNSNRNPPLFLTGYGIHHLQIGFRFICSRGTKLWNLVLPAYSSSRTNTPK